MPSLRIAGSWAWAAERETTPQEAFQRLSLVLPACTMRTIELTIIERASLLVGRLSSSAAITRSGPEQAGWGLALGRSTKSNAAETARP
jgi:hypothetical protein